MNYELAKQLKEAGFPLTPTSSQESPQLETDLVIDHVRYQYPTLSELIKACPKEINGYYFNLSANSQGWIAVYEQWESEFIETLTSEGKTPEEAVARLYLALNKK